MKLTQIRKKCMAAKWFQIAEAEHGTQWVTDGANYYMIVGIKLKEEYLQDVFALTDKQADRYIRPTINRREEIFRENYTAVGEALEPWQDVWFFDQRILVIRSAEGVMYVPRDALAPTSFESWDDLRLVHDAKGRPMIAVYCGMFCEALLCPIDPGVAADMSQRLMEIGASPVFGLEEGSEDMRKIQ